jgi:hypothetical protein
MTSSDLRWHGTIWYDIHIKYSTQHTCPWNMDSNRTHSFEIIMNGKASWICILAYWYGFVCECLKIINFIMFHQTVDVHSIYQIPQKFNIREKRSLCNQWQHFDRFNQIKYFIEFNFNYRLSLDILAMARIQAFFSDLSRRIWFLHFPNNVIMTTTRDLTTPQDTPKTPQKHPKHPKTHLNTRNTQNTQKTQNTTKHHKTP